MDYGARMILQCPKCSARFAVPDALLPPEGRTVKCGRCANQWHADASVPMENESFAAMASAAQAEDVPFIPAQLPVRQPKPLRAWPFASGALAAAVTWIIVAFIAYYPQWMPTPFLGAIYESVGLSSTEGLVFEDVSMQRNTTGNKTQFLLSGSITNQAAQQRIVPTVRVQLKNDKGATIWAREYPVNERLAPGAPYAFRIDNVETNFADNVAAITLDLGHPLQLMMR